jgi:hypothetical protein
MELRCCINITCRKLFQCWIHWFENLGSSVTFRNLISKSRLTTLPCCIHNLQPPNMDYDRNSLSKYLTRISIQSNVVLWKKLELGAIAGGGSPVGDMCFLLDFDAKCVNDTEVFNWTFFTDFIEGFVHWWLPGSSSVVASCLLCPLF